MLKMWLFHQDNKGPTRTGFELTCGPHKPIIKKKKADLLPPEICEEDLQAINEVVQDMHPVMETTVNRKNKKRITLWKGFLPKCRETNLTWDKALLVTLLEIRIASKAG